MTLKQLESLERKVWSAREQAESILGKAGMEEHPVGKALDDAWGALWKALGNERHNWAVMADKGEVLWEVFVPKGVAIKRTPNRFIRRYPSGDEYEEFAGRTRDNAFGYDFSEAMGHWKAVA